MGSHLAELMLGLGNEVNGLDVPGSNKANISHLKDRIAHFECDLREPATVKSILKDTAPDIIFHLAGQSSVMESWKDPEGTKSSNVDSQVNLMDAVMELKTKPSIHIACSSEEYGAVAVERLPITEEHELKPLSPYAESKVEQERTALKYVKEHGLKIVRTRAFNHIGPRQSGSFAIPSFAKQIALIKKKKAEPVIMTGNLNAKRDFTDVRDVAKAYWLAATKGVPGEVYNVCSGRSVSLKDILSMMIAISGVHVEVRRDPSKARPSEIPDNRGDSTKFRKATGWAPEIPLEQTLKDILEFYSLAV